jgi:hypothetical protein
MSKQFNEPMACVVERTTEWLILAITAILPVYTVTALQALPVVIGG